MFNQSIFSLGWMATRDPGTAFLQDLAEQLSWRQSLLCVGPQGKKFLFGWRSEN